MRGLAHEHSGHETILLVEDDEAVRDAIGHELVVLGYRVVEASRRPEALRVAAGQPGRRIDLLLTDVVMPGMDGFTLAARLREKQPGLKVIFSSGYARDVALRQSPRPQRRWFPAQTVKCRSIGTHHWRGAGRTASRRSRDH